MIRGTTPTLHFNLPFKTSIIKSAEIVLKYVDNNKKVIIERELEDCEVGITSISTKLTQEETLRIPAPSTVSVQLRILTIDDEALATKIHNVSVKKLLKDGVIE